MKTLDAAGSVALLPYQALVDALRAAAKGVAEGEIRCPQRQVLALSSGGALLSMMASAPDLAVHKLVTFVPSNSERGIPAIQGQVSIWNARTGAHLVTLDGASVTGRRTAALSMLGVRAFRLRPPKSFRIFGTGTQALHHLEAIVQLYPEARISVSGRTPRATKEFCARHAGLSLLLSAADRRSAMDTDVLITCTSSQEPVYDGPARNDCLVIATGAFTPAAAEIGAVTVRASRLYVDTLEGARQEAGDLIRAGVDWQSVRSLWQGLMEKPPADRAVMFKTVGLAAWDLAAARVAVANLKGGEKTL